MPLKKETEVLYRLAFCVGLHSSGHKICCMDHLKKRHCVKFGTSLSLKIESSIVLSMTQDALTIRRDEQLENSIPNANF